MGNLLKAECRELPVMALSTVNPRHPLPEDQMRVLDRSQQISASPLRLFARFTRCMIAAFRDTIEILYLRLRLRAAYRANTAPVSVLMKTWCFHGLPKGNGPDFYYGALPGQLAKRGVGCVVLWDDNRESPFASAEKDPENRYVPELGLVPLWAPIWTLWAQLSLVLAIRRVSGSSNDPEWSRFCDVAASESVSPLTLRNTLAYYVAKSAVEKWRPKAFLTLYEGQPWESLARQGVKAADQGCLNVAYQHAIVLPHSLTLSDPSPRPGELSVPDVVLSTGEVTADIIRRGHAAFQTKIVPYGSPRRVADQSVLAPQPDRRTVLVLPEGFLSESKILFDFALEAASLLPDHRFVFRTHPAFPFDGVRQYLESDPDKFANVELSTNAPIKDDFERSSALLYRGTSAVLYAVLAGLKPYYVNLAGLRPVDPLFQLEEWPESTSGVQEFCEGALNYSRRSPVDARPEWERAAAYVERYTQPVTDESIDRFVSAVGMTID